MTGNNIKRAIKVLSGIVMSAAMVTVLGQGCGIESTSSNSLSSLGGQCGGSTSVIDKNYIVEDDRGTVAIMYGDQLLFSFLACTGVGQASTRTQQEFNTRRTALSEYGDLRDISPANFMAITAIAVEVCKDLVIKEASQPDNQRGIFIGANLGGGGLSGATIDSAASLMSLACWQRPITGAEQVAIRSAVSAINQNSELQAISLCTAVLSSLSAVKI